MSNPINIPLNEIFVVIGKCGRFNGSMYIRTKTKQQANDLGQTCGWLENGRVIKRETKNVIDYYKENELCENEQQVIDFLIENYPSEIEQINQLTEEGKWVEIEWGC